MATLIQLSATSWLNMDMLTLIRQEEEQWYVWVSGQEVPLRLAVEEARTIEYYVRMRADNTAYNQTR